MVILVAARSGPLASDPRKGFIGMIGPLPLLTVSDPREGRLGSDQPGMPNYYPIQESQGTKDGEYHQKKRLYTFE